MLVFPSPSDGWYEPVFRRQRSIYSNSPVRILGFEASRRHERVFIDNFGPNYVELSRVLDL